MKHYIKTSAISFFMLTGAVITGSIIGGTSPALAASNLSLISQHSFLKLSTDSQCSSSASDFACMITKIKSIQAPLPFCANAVNAICEKRARTRCEGVEPKEKYNQCIDFETMECEQDEKCSN